uniref:Uncharacterized protein n=1 Tax=viral metagenome TaxID=1070528 RepID=A0A6C0JU59_9ZZZZ
MNTTRKIKRYLPKSKDMNYLIYRLLQSLMIVKLYHWNTTSYSVHKATDELYGELNTKIDTFIEVLLGKQTTHKNSLLDIHTLQLKTFKHPTSFLKWLEQFKTYLIRLNIIFSSNEHSDLLNIRDEILAELNKITYLLSFK